MAQDSSADSAAHPFSDTVRYDRPCSAACKASVSAGHAVAPPTMPAPSTTHRDAPPGAQAASDSERRPRRALSSGLRSFGRRLDEAYAEGPSATCAAPAATSAAGEAAPCSGSVEPERDSVDHKEAAATCAQHTAARAALHSLHTLFEDRAARAREVETPFGARVATCADASVQGEPLAAIEALVATEAADASRSAALWAYAREATTTALGIDGDAFALRFVTEGGAAAALWQAARLVGLRRKVLKARRPVVLYSAACSGAVERLWRGTPVTAVVRSPLATRTPLHTPTSPCTRKPT